MSKSSENGFEMPPSDNEGFQNLYRANDVSFQRIKNDIQFTDTITSQNMVNSEYVISKKSDPMGSSCGKNQINYKNLYEKLQQDFQQFQEKKNVETDLIKQQKQGSNISQQQNITPEYKLFIPKRVIDYSENPVEEIGPLQIDDLEKEIQNLNLQLLSQQQNKQNLNDLNVKIQQNTDEKKELKFNDDIIHLQQQLKANKISLNLAINEQQQKRAQSAQSTKVLKKISSLNSSVQKNQKIKTLPSTRQSTIASNMYFNPMNQSKQQLEVPSLFIEKKTINQIQEQLQQLQLQNQEQMNRIIFLEKKEKQSIANDIQTKISNNNSPQKITQTSPQNPQKISPHREHQFSPFYQQNMNNQQFSMIPPIQADLNQSILQYTNTQLNSLNQKVKQEMIKYKQYFEDMKIINDKLSVELKNAVTAIQQLDEEKVVLQKQLETLLFDQESNQQKLAQIQFQNKELEFQLNQQQEVLNHKNYQFQQLQEEILQKDIMLSNKTKDVDLAKSRIEKENLELILQAQNSIQSIDQLNLENKQFQITINEQNDKLMGYFEQIQNLQNQVQMQNSVIADYKKQFQIQQQCMDQDQQKLMQLNLKLSTLQQQNVQLDSKAKFIEDINFSRKNIHNSEQKFYNNNYKNEDDLYFEKYINQFK